MSDMDSLDNLNCSDNQTEQTEENFLHGQTVDEYVKNVMNLVKQVQKNANDLKDFWKEYAGYPEVDKTMSSVYDKLNNIICKIFNHQDIKVNLAGYKLKDQYNLIVEGIDTLTDRINSDIDKASGANKNHAAESLDTSIITLRGPVNEESGREMVLLASRNIGKPQINFSPKINNSDKEPFIPTITEKPNSIKPLSIMLCVDPNGREYYSHPYQYELEHWNPPEELLERNDPIKPLSMSRTPFLLVENEESLRIVVDELKQEKEIAVDLEHHDFRSYQGLTCLIQISSRTKDYIIDPFPIRNRLPLLNEVFTDPKIVKVFHGSDKDILWLQKDCGVYVVNMFDTHQAAIVLEYQQRSLSYLLQTMCSVNADKTYQRADWRIRPLPEDFIKYARQDTHYLLYIYDVIKNELIENGNQLNNLLCSTFNRSMELCLQRYEKPITDSDSHMVVYRRSKKTFNSRQLFALQQIYLWRDKRARQHDESPEFILPKHMMLQMAEVLPKEVQGIFACCRPTPTSIKEEHLTLHHIIRSARNLPLEEIHLESEKHVKSDPIHQYSNTNDLMTSLECKFDLSHVEEDGKGLSTLLNPQETLLGDLFNHTEFEDELKKSSEFWEMESSYKTMRILLKEAAKEYMSPFQRFSISMEYFKAEEKKKAEEKHKKQQQIEANNIQRLESIKDHFLTLSSKMSKKVPDNSRKIKNRSTCEKPHNSEASSNSVSSSSGEISNDTTSSSIISDQERMARLQNHISSLTSSMRNTVSKMNQNSPNKGNSKKLNKRLKRLKNSENSKSSNSNPLKRRSTDADTFDIGTKKQKTKGKEEEEEELEEGEIEENKMEEGEEESVSIKPFDYSKADLSAFRSKKAKKIFKGQRIKQKFKQNKGKSGVFRNDTKSISWANNG